MEQHRKSRALSVALVAAAFALLLLVPYVWMYYSVVTAIPGSTHPDGGIGCGYTIYQSKPVANFLARHELFDPMHWLDRRIRPHVWHP